MLAASTQQYRHAFDALLGAAKQSKLIIFVFQDNLLGVFARRRLEDGEPYSLEELEQMLIDRHDYNFLKAACERLRDYLSRPEEVHALISRLYECGAEIAPFFRRSEISVRLQEFLSDLEQSIYLRLFIPDDRIQAEQLRSLLEVLERYLRQIEGQDFSIDSHKTGKGTVYLFKSRGLCADSVSLTEAFQRFDDFMKACEDAPDKAEAILRAKGMNGRDAAMAVNRYSRDYRRLIIDTRHEFEMKSLLLRQRLELALVDNNATASVSLSEESLSGILRSVGSGETIAINIANLETLSVVKADQIRNQVDQLVNGSITYNEYDRELLDLISRLEDGLKVVQYRSDLDQLKDKSAPEPARRNSRQKLIAFLGKAASKTGEIAQGVATEALKQYIDSLIK